ncbi:MAG: family 43 glycosylhydrolase [Lachnospiraceae bacterium]|nr:family 43 glycosylhydrolase [Lachnospiraceae bacterium]
MEQKRMILAPEKNVDFQNRVDFCIGTGRMGLALHKEYYEQLKLVQEEIGFRHIRGHGLFCDDMAIYQVGENGTVEYNYTYLDRVMDSYRELGLKPFLELGFMPERLASGTQTVFYWKGNTTPPASYEAWCEMVKALLLHLCDRYGRDEVVTWPVEVWNEPNLPGFWEHADMQEYLRLFHNTFCAVKSVDSRFRVGGPAVCGGSDEIWIKAFMQYCHDNSIAVDFVTRHHYTTEFPENVGHYGYAELMKAEDGFANLHTTREIIDSFPEYKGLEIHITEFNTSYIPNCPLHDTNQNAAFIAQQLARLGEDNASYSYWTFGDVFEEQGVPFTPFHGGFGLVANGCIPKPTFWSFAFFKKLKEKPGHCIHRDNNAVVMCLEDGTYRGVVWNMTNNRRGYDFTLTLEMAENGEGCLLTKTVDEKHCNPLKAWHDLGEPANLTKEENELLRTTAVPYTRTARVIPQNGRTESTFTVAENAVVYFEWKPGRVKPDRGYSYERTMQYPHINPITRLDYPDVDVIRVEDTYYMVSTTMHFMPGCEILRSYDLRNWEHAAYVYDTLDGTPGQKLEGEQSIYGQGMWAASLRYHRGTYYICFVANDTHKTYLYTADKIEGPWEKHFVEGFYHDCSLLFDDDDRVYIAYGNKNIYITELKKDLSGPLEGGLHRLAVSDEGNPNLGYEGTHFYKINGKYYLFFIHSKRECWRRTESCFVADSLTGEFTGGDVLDDDRGYCGQGVAQGGIVDTPDGKWYAMLFQDSGAVGRIPILMPLTWEKDYPVFGDNGKIPEEFPVESTRPGYVYRPLTESDDFKGELKPCWQFNHEPDKSLIFHDREKGSFRVQTDKICQELTRAKNMITQRMAYPGCAGEVTVDGSNLKEGDYAGICVLQSCYGFVGVTRREGRLYLTVRTMETEGHSMMPLKKEESRERETAAILLEESVVRLKLEVEFTNMQDTASFYYRGAGLQVRNPWVKAGGEHKLYFKLDHFTGCRFGLVVYSTEEAGGSAEFRDFVYRDR